MVGVKDAGPSWSSSFGIAGAAFTSANQKLMVQTSAAGNVAVTAHYYSES